MQEIDRSYRRNLHSVVWDHVEKDVIEKRNSEKSWKYGYCSEYDMVIISKNGTIGEIIDINNLKIALPEVPKNTIRFTGLPREKQKWERYSAPDDLTLFDKLYAKENVEVKINEIAIKHKTFIDADFKRIEDGDFFVLDGEPCYIPGGYYFFLQWYFLPEDGMYPQFRMPQRDYFIWLEACYADNRCVGSLLLKSRRSAFTVTTSSEILRDAIRHYNSYYPIMADVEKHARKIFANYIVNPFNSFPKHLQPQRVGEVTPKKELIFDAPKRKITTNSKVSTEADGLVTSIEYTATTLNAYDSTRPRLSFNDEIGKPEIDIIEWWAVHKKCHLEGRKLKGKAICGSTANPPHKGGKAYEQLYQNSKLSTRGSSGFTKSGLYSIFIPGDFAQTGFFDQWGYVVYHNTTEPILRDDGEYQTQGSKEFLDEKEAQNADNIKSYNYEKRQDPRVDTDPFLDENMTNTFATAGLANLINLLKSDFSKTDKFKTEVFRFNLSWKNGIKDCGEVELNPSANGRWEIYAPDGLIPIPKEFRNKSEMRNGRKSPINGHLAGLGVDPYTANRAQYGGSKQGIIGVTTKFSDLSDRQKQITFLHYNFRGETYEEGVEDVIKACVYFSIPVLIERNKDSLIKDIAKRGYRGYIASDPFKKKSELNADDVTLGGIYSLNNIDKQENKLDSYIKNFFPDQIEENKIKCPFLELNTHASEYTRQNRGSKDDVVAWQLALALTSKDPKKKEKPIAQNMQPQDLLDLFAFNQ